MDALGRHRRAPEGRLVLVRHSVSEVSPGIAPARWPLSPLGRMRCLGLAEQLRVFHPRTVFSSHEVKASETAQIVAGRLGVTHQTVDGLQEHERSRADFAPGPGEFEARLARFFNEPQSLVFGRETADEANHRFTRVVSGLIEDHQSRVDTGEALCVVSHGAVISLFVSNACDDSPLDFWRKLGQPSYVVMSLPEFELLSLETRILGDCSGPPQGMGRLSR